MSKITNALIMLELLESGKKYSLNELASELGVTKRMIRYYKEQLELAGIIIESYKGPNGGYFINKKNQFKISFFNKYDLNLLESIKTIIEKQNNEKLQKDYNELLNRLKSIYELNKKVSEYNEIDVTLLDSDQKIKTIEEAIKTHSKLHILYQNIEGTYSKRDISPITFFEFENRIFLTAFCYLRGTIRHFEVQKILEYKIIK